MGAKPLNSEFCAEMLATHVEESNERNMLIKELEAKEILTEAEKLKLLVLYNRKYNPNIVNNYDNSYTYDSSSSFMDGFIMGELL